LRASIEINPGNVLVMLSVIPEVVKEPKAKRKPRRKLADAPAATVGNDLSGS
jgi:hypothetical protein